MIEPWCPKLEQRFQSFCEIHFSRACWSNQSESLSFVIFSNFIWIVHLSLGGGHYFKKESIQSKVIHTISSTFESPHRL